MYALLGSRDPGARSRAPSAPLVVRLLSTGGARDRQSHRTEGDRSTPCNELQLGLPVHKLSNDGRMERRNPAECPCWLRLGARIKEAACIGSVDCDEQLVPWIEEVTRESEYEACLFDREELHRNVG